MHVNIKYFQSQKIYFMNRILQKINISPISLKFYSCCAYRSSNCKSSS